MATLRLAGIPAAVALLLAPVVARAQSCYSLTSERNDINRRAERLVADNPGSAIVFGGCVAVGADNYRRTHSQSSSLGTFTVCAGVGCALTGDMSNCMSVGSQLFIYAIRVLAIEERMRRQGCRV